jgi:hypothetical protein
MAAQSLEKTTTTSWLRIATDHFPRMHCGCLHKKRAPPGLESSEFHSERRWEPVDPAVRRADLRTMQFDADADSHPRSALLTAASIRSQVVLASVARDSFPFVGRELPGNDPTKQALTLRSGSCRRANVRGHASAGFHRRSWSSATSHHVGPHRRSGRTCDAAAHPAFGHGSLRPS